MDKYEDAFSMEELIHTLPSTKKKDTIYGLVDGLIVKHTLLRKKRNGTCGSTWIGVVVNGTIYHSGKYYCKPSHFVKAHCRENRGSSLSDYDMEVLWVDENIWVPYSLFIR